MMKKIILILSLFCSIYASAETEKKSEAVDQKVQDYRDPDKVYIETGKYVTGGVLASTVGFGIGHAVQGRYSTKGWIFTAAEGAGVLLLAKGNCFRGRQDSPDRSVRERSDCENVTEGIVGAGLIIGFKVWEILDAWIVAKPIPSASSVMILPKNDGASLAVSLTF